MVTGSSIKNPSDRENPTHQSDSEDFCKIKRESTYCKLVLCMVPNNRAFLPRTVTLTPF
jgi:hypothetical protein